MNNTKHPKTIWTFIKDEIEIKIINGNLRFADKVPSISEIANDYEVSKTTAQKVLEDMFNDGTITKRKGVGYFVMPYTREKLRTKHKALFYERLDECLEYIEKLNLDSSDYEDIVKVFVSRINNISSR